MALKSMLLLLGTHAPCPFPSLHVQLSRVPCCQGEWVQDLLKQNEHFLPDQQQDTWREKANQGRIMLSHFKNICFCEGLIDSIKDYINCTHQRGIFSGRYQWNARKVCLAEGIWRGLKARWRGGWRGPPSKPPWSWSDPLGRGAVDRTLFLPHRLPRDYLSAPWCFDGTFCKRPGFPPGLLEGRCKSVPSSGHWCQFFLSSSTTHKTPCPLPTAYCFSTTVPGTSHCSFEDLGNSGCYAAVKLWGLLLSAPLISLHLNSS